MLSGDRLSVQKREQILLLEKYLRNNHPENVLMPCDKGKSPLLKHSDKPYGWDRWDAHKQLVGKPLYDARVFSHHGILLRDLFVIDIDPDEKGGRTYQEIYDDFVSRFPFSVDAPMETTKRGCHLFFKRTAYCDEHKVATSIKPTDEYFDIKTITNQGHLIDGVLTKTRSLVIVAPSPDRVWVRPLWNTELKEIPDSFIDYIANNTQKKKPRGKGKATLLKELSVPSKTYEMPEELKNINIRRLVDDLLLDQKHDPMIVYSMIGNKIYLKNLDGRSHTCPNKQKHEHNNAEIYMMPEGGVLYKCWGAAAVAPYKNKRCDTTLYDFGRWKTLLLSGNYALPTEKKNELPRYLRESMFPTCDFIKERIDYFTYNEKYVLPFTEHEGYGRSFIESLYKHIVLKSHLGTGKTTQIRNYVDRTQPKSVLILSPRIKFATSIYRDFQKLLPKLVLYYKLEKGCINEKFVVCQMESIRRLTLDKYDLIVCDECESNITQFKSETMKDFAECVDKFSTLVRNADKVLWTDAFIGDRTFHTVKSLSGKKDRTVYIENIYNPYERESVEIVGSGNLCLQVVDLVLQGKKVVCPIGSKQLAHSLVRMLEEETDANVLCIDSGSGKEMNEGMECVNEYWIKYDVVIYTTTITVGVNFDVEHFDCMCMYMSAMNATVRDMFQASVRVRKLKDNVLFWAINGQLKENPSKRFPVYDRGVLWETIAKWEHHFFLKADNQKHIHYLNNFLRDLWVIIQQEQNISTYLHHEMIQKYLAVCGYTPAGGGIDDECELERIVPELGDIDDLDGRISYEKLDGYMRNQEATAEDKLVCKKYKFQHDYFKGGGDIEWEQFFLNGHDIIERLWKARYEFGGYDMKPTTVYHGNKTQRLNELKTMCALLGIDNTHDTETRIPVENYERTLEYIQGRRDDIQKIFGTWRLGEIFTDWGFSQLRKGKRVRKRVNGVLTDITDFKITIKKINIKKHREDDDHWVDIYPKMRVMIQDEPEGEHMPTYKRKFLEDQRKNGIASGSYGFAED